MLGLYRKVSWGWSSWLAIRGFITGSCLQSFTDGTRRTHSMWALVTYVFVAIKSYYIFRASTSYIVYFIIYHSASVSIIKAIMFLLVEEKYRRSRVAIFIQYCFSIFNRTWFYFAPV